MYLLWLILGLLHLRSGLRFRGAKGRARFEQLDERRARGIYELFTSKVVPFMSLAGISICTLGLLFALLVQSLLGATLWGVAALLLLVALVVRRRTEQDVAAAFSKRDLQPLQRRDSSVRRTRRQKQFGVVALVANALAEIARYFGARDEQPALVIVAALAMLTAFGAIGALLWSTAWVFGDEKPA